MFLGFPFVATLSISTLICFLFFFPTLDPVVIAQQMAGAVKPAALVAVPMFIFAAEIMTRGQTANRLLYLVETFVGHVRGGLTVTTAVTCTLFGAVSGSTQATVVAIGQPLKPKLLAKGYSNSFANALIINASDIALLIPPSIGLIIYGVVSGTSVGELFIGGILPGLLILVCFCAYGVFYAHRHKINVEEPYSWEARLKALKAAIPALGFPVIIVGGIYGGIFSPTEAAAFSVLYAILLECLVFRELKLSHLKSAALSTGIITSVVFLLVAAGGAFSWLLSYANIPQLLVAETLNLTAESSQFKILLTTTIAYFIGCMFADPIVVIMILTPIFHPIAVDAGIDPVQMGVIATLQAAIGSATPPFGCDIFTAIAIFREKYVDIIRGTPPFIFILLVISALIILIPEISLFLRDLAFK